MVRFDTIGAAEKLYPYVKATAAAEYKNGTFGTVANGVFTAAASAFSVIMQVEKGDDMHSDEYVVNKDEEVRVCDLSKAVGYVVDITADELPETLEVGNKLVSTTDGILEVSASASSNCLEVTEVTSWGAKAVIVGATE